MVERSCCIKQYITEGKQPLKDRFNNTADQLTTHLISPTPPQSQSILLLIVTLLGDHIRRLKVHPWIKYFCVFYLFQLKLCRMVEFCIPENSMFFCFSILTFLVGKGHHKTDIKKKWLKVTENLRVDKKSLKHVQAFQTELKFGSVGF